MILEAREQVKSLLAIRCLTMKKLAGMLTVATGKTCSPSALSNKLRRGTITYNEVMKIAEILGFNINYNMNP